MKRHAKFEDEQDKPARLGDRLDFERHSSRSSMGSSHVEQEDINLDEVRIWTFNLFLCCRYMSCIYYFRICMLLTYLFFLTSWEKCYSRLIWSKDTSIRTILSTTASTPGTHLSQLCCSINSNTSSTCSSCWLPSHKLCRHSESGSWFRS